MSKPEELGGGVRNTQEWMWDAVRRPVPLEDSAFLPYAGRFDFRHFQLGVQVLQLLLDTVEFRERALSYRGFQVAAGAWCLSNDGRRGRTLGYNVKTDQTNKVNIHAEDLALRKAIDGRFNEIATLAIIGPTQEDHASGMLTETLHPCGRCRFNLSQSPLMTERTLIVTARPDFRVIQFASLMAILAAHETGDTSGITTFRYSATPDAFTPRPRDVWMITPEMVESVDTTEYDETIGYYLLTRSVNIE